MKWKWLTELPTTNLRIFMTLLLAFGSGIKVLFTSWSPTWEWLGFLCIWAGLDVAQFTAKRMTTFQDGNNS